MYVINTVSIYINPNNSLLLIALCKKIDALEKDKECELVGKWKKSVINHLYWSAVSAPNGDGEMILTKWISLDNHIHNKHMNSMVNFFQFVSTMLYRKKEGKTSGLNQVIS